MSDTEVRTNIDPDDTSKGEVIGVGSEVIHIGCRDAAHRQPGAVEQSTAGGSAAACCATCGSYNLSSLGVCATCASPTASQRKVAEAIRVAVLSLMENCVEDQDIDDRIAAVLAAEKVTGPEEHARLKVHFGNMSELHELALGQRNDLEQQLADLRDTEPIRKENLERTLGDNRELRQQLADLREDVHKMDVRRAEWAKECLALRAAAKELGFHNAPAWLAALRSTGEQTDGE